MSQPFLAEIRLMSFNFAPKGWAQCNGQLLPINQNQALFSLLGTTYGGDGRTTFALPDLRGRIPIYTGNGFVLGQRGGETAHTVNIGELPSHNHVPNGSTGGPTLPAPNNNVWATLGTPTYAGSPNSAMNPACIANAGGSQPHNNMSPYLTITFCIALQGIFPSRN